MIDVFFECGIDKILLKESCTTEEALMFIKNDMIEFCKKQEPVLEVPTKTLGKTYECWGRTFTIVYKIGDFAWSFAKTNA